MISALILMVLHGAPSRLFVEVKADQPDKRRMLPLQHQQDAFERVYLKAQEGMRFSVIYLVSLSAPFIAD